MNNYNVMINGKTFLINNAKNDLRTYDIIRKVAIGQWDDYTTDCLFKLFQ